MRLAAGRGWPRPFLATMGLSVLVAAGVGDGGLLLPAVLLGAAALCFAVLFRLFPGGLDFALGAGIGFATYAALFTVVGGSAFPDAPEAVAGAAFLLPVAAFLAAVIRRRAPLRRIVEGGETPDERHLRRIGRLFLVMAAIAAASLALPANRLGPAGQAVAMLAGSALIGALVARAVRELVRLLVDIAQLMDALGGRVVALVVPIAAYAALFSLITIVFACLFRIADGLSRGALFAGPAGPMRLGFRDALHFSLVTISTVGYGDIWPVDDGARLLSAVEVLAGQILLLFGFYEITRDRLSGEAAPIPDAGTDADGGPAPRCPAAAAFPSPFRRPGRPGCALPGGPDGCDDAQGDDSRRDDGQCNDDRRDDDRRDDDRRDDDRCDDDRRDDDRCDDGRRDHRRRDDRR